MYNLYVNVSITFGYSVNQAPTFEYKKEEIKSIRNNIGGKHLECLVES